MSAFERTVKAKFHYTGPTGPDRTRTDFVGDQHGPNVWVRAGPVGPVWWNLAKN